MSTSTLKVADHFAVERARHGRFFDLIKNDTNWKYPIRCIIPKRDFDEFDRAVRHFTAGGLYVVKDHGNTLECKANGYYVDCGA